MNARDNSFLDDGQSMHRPHLPDVFCWTKIGAEAGQTLEDIIRRKEFERIAGNGRFGWGIGNALGEAPILATAAVPKGRLKVVFSTMKSPPKPQDVNPAQICIWTKYQLPSGEIRPLDQTMLITSRYNEKKTCHYALICSSETPLLENALSEKLPSKALRNFLSEKLVGASQVTSVVRFRSEESQMYAMDYPVTFSAELDKPGFVRLVDPVVVSGVLNSLYFSMLSQRSYENWSRSMSEIWGYLSSRVSSC